MLVVALILAVVPYLIVRWRTLPPTIGADATIPANNPEGNVMTPAAPDANQLAVDRTRLAHERTLMAWIRTAVSLISFGFTIFKFFQYLHESQPDRPHSSLLGPHLYAVLMIAIGLISLVLAALQHRQEIGALRKSAGPTAHFPYSLAGVIAVLVAGLGVIALIAVSFRW
jgi:putative membrane protein